jgi:trehalose-phosphatase
VTDTRDGTAPGPPAEVPEQLAARLPAVERLLVVVDFDGTLSEIVDRPGGAEPVPGATAVLDRLAARTSVAVVSGRPIADLRSRLGPLPVAWAGGHGAEIEHRDGSRDDLIDATTFAPVLTEVEDAVSEALDDAPGWLVERKPTSLAVHHRLASPASVDALLPRVEALLSHHAAREPGGVLLHGKAVVELRPAGVDKGAALSRLAQRTPGLVPVAIGDDTTDEDAFTSARELGGHGILVAVDARPTAATARVEGPTDVVALLEALLR